MAPSLLLCYTVHRTVNERNEVICVYKIGLSSCGFSLTEENFRALKESKIDVIEISMRSDRYADIDYKELKNLSQRYEVGLWSYHLPFDPFSEIDISSTDRKLRENAIRLYTTMIEKAADIGIDKFIIHPSGEPIPSEERAERMRYSMQTLDTLAEIAHRCGAVIAVEDLPRTCIGNNSDEITKLIGANDKLRVCFDTNHLLGEDAASFVKKLADKIVTVHVSDYDFVDERHWLPGEGKLDWKALFEALEEVGYSGVWLYELGLKCSATIARDRDLTFGDFYDNAMQIFSRKVPTAVGVPKT